MKDHAYFTGWHLRGSSYEDRVREVFESFLSDEQSTSTYVERVLSRRSVTQWDRLSKSRLYDTTPDQREQYFRRKLDIIEGKFTHEFDPYDSGETIEAGDTSVMDEFLGDFFYARHTKHNLRIKGEC